MRTRIRTEEGEGGRVMVGIVSGIMGMDMAREARRHSGCCGNMGRSVGRSVGVRNCLMRGDSGVWTGLSM